MSNRPLFYLIDGSSYIYRAFYAIPALNTSKGFPTNAIYGFITMLLKILKEKQPDYLAIAFDPKGPTQRSHAYQDYKSHRPPMPENLVPQIPYIHRVVEGFQIPVLLEQGFEADDLIGTYARLAAERDLDVMIVSGDKDMLQLVSPRTRIYDPMKDKTIRIEEVISRFGVGPDQVVEIMGLMGDSSDNIPGVPGIGEKTAVRLIKEYGSIDHLLNTLDQMKPSRLKENLAANAGMARLSRDLATINLQAPHPVPVEELKVKPADAGKLTGLFAELEFYSLLKNFKKEKHNTAEFKIVDSPDDLISFMTQVRKSGEVILEPFYFGPSPREAEFIGLALGIGHFPLDVPFFVVQSSPYFANFKPLLEDQEIRKIGHDLKTAFLLLKKKAIDLKGFHFDTMIASYLIHPNHHKHTLEEISLEHLHVEKTVKKDLFNTDSRGILFNSISLNKAAAFASETVDLIARVKEPLTSLLETYQLNSLFYELEIPLAGVLAEMEMIGIKLDVLVLENISKELEQQLNALTEKIYHLAGGEFNINSPKQLAEILFDRLKLTPLRKTKTGYSTDEGVLTQLALQHELPAEIVNYRQLTKLKSTYVDVLPGMVNPDTGRLHTSFNQTVAATGRLSSSDPNLQNIPVRGEWGTRIRRAFIAEKGWKVLSADYNQIELRILAHMSNDPRLIQSFIEGEDVHRRTAAQIFKVSPDQITKEMRRAAKTVNFGIIYGMGAFSLAADLGITQREAKKYIESYFSYYEGVKVFIEKTISGAKTSGFVNTLFNRRRLIPELNSSNAAVRSFGERLAVNTPIQGSAADIIKMAMVSIERKIKKEEKQIRMILQIHDELLFEIPDHQMVESKTFVQNEMEQVTRLSVPITVDIGIGNNWSEAH
ncbi:MAG: DNA polymerase I [Nitrospiria bacterium]